MTWLWIMLRIWSSENSKQKKCLDYKNVILVSGPKKRKCLPSTLRIMNSMLNWSGKIAWNHSKMPNQGVPVSKMPKISSGLNPEHLSEKIPIPILPYILVPEQEHQLECRNLGYYIYFFRENTIIFMKIFLLQRFDQSTFAKN